MLSRAWIIAQSASSVRHHNENARIYQELHQVTVNIPTALIDRFRDRRMEDTTLVQVLQCIWGFIQSPEDVIKPEVRLSKSNTSYILG